MARINDPEVVTKSTANHTTISFPRPELYFADGDNEISLSAILKAMRSIDPKIFDNDIANIQKKNHEFKYPVLSAEEARKQQHGRK